MYLKANSPHAAAAGKSVIGFNVIHGKEVEGDLALIQAKSAIDSRDLVGMFPDSGEKDVARAAKAAADAFKHWSRSPLTERVALVKRAEPILASHQEKLARIITREIGMTSREALAEVQEAIHACAFFTAEARQLPGAILPSGTTPHRRAVGVCGILATGSSPVAAPLRKMLPALLAGNTIVWKPSDNAPTAAYLLLRALMEAGLPPGVVNTVNGRGRTGCGKHLLAGIEKGHFQAFGFVGSTPLGRTVAELCGRQLIQPSLDLVGKGTMLLMPDADLDLAAKDGLAAAFGQAGQRPVGLMNILVHEACASDFRQRFLDGLAQLPLGNPMSDATVAFGPMINARSATAFREHLEQGKKDGATLLTGGDTWSEANRTDQVKGDISHGLYEQPAVWEGVTPDMGIFQSQVLGPTVNLCVVKDLDEAMEWAHRAPGRVCSSLYTHERPALERFRKESPADRVTLNRPATDPASWLPFAGQGTHPGGQSPFGTCTRWQAVDDAPHATPKHSPLKTDWEGLA